MQLRKSFIRIFGAPASVIPLAPLIQVTGQRQIFPLYHVVSDYKLPHIQHLYAYKNEQAFENDLDFILKHYSPIHVDEVIEHFNKNNRINYNAFLLTFDDGLREFHDVIAPILLRKGIPAVCFCNTDFIDNKNMFFRYKASVLIAHFYQHPDLLAKKSIVDFFSEHLKSSSDNFLNALLQIAYHQTPLLEELATIAGLDMQEFIFKQQPYLKTAQIISLQEKGFIFGAHSTDHPEYKFLDLNNQLQQTKESIVEMHKLTNDKRNLFAFPFSDDGVPKLFFESMASDENSPALTFGCAGLKKDSVANNLQRIPMEVAGRTAKQILSSEYLYYIAKSFIYRNTIRRN